MSLTGKMLALGLLSLLILGHSTSAGAALRICNKTSTPASVAVGMIGGLGAITHGWYNVEPGGCTTYDGFDGTAEAKGSLTYYYYAHSSAGAWSGDTPMCVDMTNLTFDFDRPTDDPTQGCNGGSAGTVEGFRRINLKTKDAELDLSQIY